jgi:hypothetical protein
MNHDPTGCHFWPPCFVVAFVIHVTYFEYYVVVERMQATSSSQSSEWNGSTQVTMVVYALLIITLVPLALSAAAEQAEPRVRITFNEHRRIYEKANLQKLKYGNAEEFTFGRFQSMNAIDDAMSGCRPSSSFKHHSANDGKEGFYCSTRLGGECLRLKLVFQP